MPIFDSYEPFFYFADFWNWILRIFALNFFKNLYINFLAVPAEEDKKEEAKKDDDKTEAEAASEDKPAEDKSEDKSEDKPAEDSTEEKKEEERGRSDTSVMSDKLVQNNIYATGKPTQMCKKRVVHRLGLKTSKILKPRRIKARYGD